MKDSGLARRPQRDKPTGYSALVSCFYPIAISFAYVLHSSEAREEMDAVPSPGGNVIRVPAGQDPDTAFDGQFHATPEDDAPLFTMGMLGKVHFCVRLVIENLTRIALQ